MKTCNECRRLLSNGTVILSADNLYHLKCLERREARERGYPYVCPVCDGEPVKHIPAGWDYKAENAWAMDGGGGPGSGGARDFTIPARTETCQQCHGQGYVKLEPKQVPTGMRWVTE